MNRHGRAEARLLPGTYEIELLHAEHPDELGFVWRPTATQYFEVSESQT